MKQVLYLVPVLLLTGCCHTAGFEDSMLCYMLRGELENYQGGGGLQTERIEIYDAQTRETRRYEIRVRR